MEKHSGKKKRGDLDFGKRFTALLSEKNCSQRKAAKTAGVSVSVINGWSSGRTPGNPSALLKLCRELSKNGTPISFVYVLTGETEIPTKGQEEAMHLGSFSLAQHFESQDFFSGLCEITIKRLVPKKRAE